MPRPLSGCAEAPPTAVKRQPISPSHLLVGLLDQGDNAALRLLERAGVRTGGAARRRSAPTGRRPVTAARRGGVQGIYSRSTVLAPS